VVFSHGAPRSIPAAIPGTQWGSSQLPGPAAAVGANHTEAPTITLAAANV
jgi:hypothetical protein